MAIRGTTMASVSRPTSSRSISQPSNTVHSSGNRSGITSHSSPAINNWGRTAPANQNTNDHVSISIHSSNTIVRNDSGSVAVNPTATAEINSSVRHETGDYSTIHMVSETEAKRTFAQSDTEGVVVRKAFTDVGEMRIRNLTDQLHRGDRLPVNAESLGAEGVPTGSRRNRPVFTGESVYSLNSKRKKKSSWKQAWEDLEDTCKELEKFIQKNVSNTFLLGYLNKLRKKVMSLPK